MHLSLSFDALAATGGAWYKHDEGHRRGHADTGRAASPKELHYAACRWQGMTKQDHLDRVWDIIERVGVCVLTTRFAGGLRARPLEARPDRRSSIIWFVTDLRSSKEHEIESEHDVGLVFVDAKANAYLSITARADVRRDPAKASEIWRATDNNGWWQGPNDPNVCVLSVHPLTAVLWDGPSSNAVAASSSSRRDSQAKSRTSARIGKVTVDLR